MAQSPRREALNVGHVNLVGDAIGEEVIVARAGRTTPFRILNPKPPSAAKLAERRPAKRTLSSVEGPALNLRDTIRVVRKQKDVPPLELEKLPHRQQSRAGRIQPGISARSFPQNRLPSAGPGPSTARGIGGERGYKSRWVPQEDIYRAQAGSRLVQTAGGAMQERSMGSFHPGDDVDGFDGEDVLGDDPRPVTSRPEYQTPRINHPQRVDPPLSLRAPPRQDPPELMTRRSDGAPIRDDPKLGGRSAANTKLADSAMLAFACRRAGRTRLEGVSYYNMGVVHDNQKHYVKAIDCYEKFATSCRRIRDREGEALAYNCIGVDYHLMGPEYLQRAIYYHKKHLEIADTAGKFVAHCNLGLAYSALERHERAAMQHQQALRQAIKLSSVVGESLACGNLGVIGGRSGDIQTARACMERHLQLSHSIRDPASEGDAYHQLGMLANMEGDFQSASHFFENSLNIATRAGDQRFAADAKCKLGFASGNQVLEEKMAEHARKLKESMQAMNGEASFSAIQ